jgi:XTP/dITP diphosphohydrolase
VKAIDELVLASSNEGKIREFKSLLAPFELKLMSQAGFGIEAPPEPHPSFVENALTKAREAARHAGRAALADDSGICIEQLNDKPGVLSARWSVLHGGFNRDEDNNRLINQQLDGRSSKAFFVCVLALLRWADDPVPLIAEARWQGQWLAEPRGQGGFGYDPHFLPDGQSLTAAELTLAQKNRLSHRANAIEQLLAQMLKLGMLTASTRSGD